jgi:TonB family protein
MAEEPKPDDIPEPDAVVKDDKKLEQPRINVQYESSVYSTQKMSAEETERAIRFLLEHGRPGTGQVGSKPSGGGGGGGKRYGDLICKKCPQPEYPFEARKMRQEGMVVLRALIGMDGRVLNIVIQESSRRYLLDQSALQKVRKWEFEPKLFTTAVDIPIKFEMEKLTEPPPPVPPP